MAETNRAPFDMAEAESELVAGFMTEYGCMGFGLFMMGEYLNIVVGACLTTVLFLGGWDCPFGLTARCMVVPDKNLHPDLLLYLDSLDLSPHPDLPAAEPVLENPDSLFPGQPADHRSLIKVF